ncbi:MAG TPA: hypothetical protein VK213_07795 [Bacteroidales bacterium]|nr:hypothetical protein [Bacteroidales bacterium]
METASTNLKDRVRENTSEDQNARLDKSVIDRMNRYKKLTLYEINARLEKIGKEWDIERALQANSSALALSGIILGTFFKRRWFLLSFVITSFLIQHAVQGWSPPLSLLRSIGFRTRQEIDEEIYALKTLRGDFEGLSATSDPSEIIAAFRR